MIAVIMTSLLFSAPALSSTKKFSSYFVSVMNEKHCPLLQAGIQDAYEQNITIDCVNINTVEAFSTNPVRKAEKSKQYRYHLSFTSDSANNPKNYWLHLWNWGRNDDVEFSELEWKISPQSEEDLSTEVKRILSHITTFDLNRDTIKISAMVLGLKSSASIEYRKDRGFVDKVTGQTITPEEAYEAFKKESPKKKNYLKAMIEIGVVWGTMTILYNWANNYVEDHDFLGTFDSQRERLIGGKGYLLDDNTSMTNFGHALAGMYYYQFARANNLNPLESFLYSFTYSTLWEVVSEYREVVSINDMIITPVGGFVIGEVFHQFSKLLRSRNNSKFANILAGFFDTPSQYKRWIGENTSENNRDIVGSGFDPAVFKAYGNAYTELVQNSNGDMGFKMGLSSEIVNIPYYEKSGSTAKVIFDTAFTELILEGSTGQNDLSEFLFLTKTVFMAYHRKNLHPSAYGASGYTMLVGPSTALEYSSQSMHTDSGIKDDWTVTLNVIGMTLDMTAMLSSGTKVRAVFDIYADFSMLKGFAVDEHGLNDNNLHVMRRDSYHYALGHTEQMKLSIEQRSVQAGYFYRKSTGNIINKYNREQDENTELLDISDSRTREEVWATYRLNDDWKLRASVENVRRWGQVEDVTVEASEQTKSIGLVFSF